jgi:trk system potassium uptake protein
MKILVLGAGNVGRAVVDALYEQHEITVIDLDGTRLAMLSERYDVRTVEGNGTTRQVLRDAGVKDAQLLFACSSREEANLVCAMLVKRLSSALAIVRTTSAEYLEAWREQEIDVDFMVSSEVETANAISGIIGIPAARQTDVFADGQVQIVEFEVPGDTPDGRLIGLPLREAGVPPDSKVVGVIRGEELIKPRGDERILAGDRVVIIGSPAAAREWSRIIARDQQQVEDIVIFGAGRMGTTIGSVLLERGLRVRFVEARAEQARRVAETLSEARVFHADACSREFLERERIGKAAAAVFAMNDDPKNLFAAVLAKAFGVRLTIALAHEAGSLKVFEQAGVNVGIDPRQVTAEEMVRFAHDPRIRQLAMLEDDRFEILDLTVREQSELTGKSFRDLPETGSMIGAVIRDGRALFPHSSELLRAGDRVIIFVESRRASLVESVL